MTQHLIRHTSRRLQMYRMVKFVIRRLFNAFKAYHKYPSSIASDARTKAISGRNAVSSRKRPVVINRNVGDNVNNNHGVSNSLKRDQQCWKSCKLERVSLPGLCSTFSSVVFKYDLNCIIKNLKACYTHSYVYFELIT
jgi:hypothetical protein